MGEADGLGWVGGPYPVLVLALNLNRRGGSSAVGALLLLLSVSLSSVATPASAGPAHAANQASSAGPLAQVGDAREAQSSQEAPQPIEVDLGGTAAPLEIVPGEHLQYEVHLRVGAVNSQVGSAAIETGFEPYRPPLFGAGSDEGGDVTWIRTSVRGGYQVYHVEQSIETRLQPSAWPRLLQRYEQAGTEQRRRELKLGVKGESNVGVLRSDTSNGAPAGGRIWRAPVEFEVPAGTMDSMCALFVVRRLCLEPELEEVAFLMVDKNRLWSVNVTRGEVRDIDTGLGTRTGVELILETSRAEPDAEQAEPGEFEGPFGIKGNLHLWFDQQTGIPLLISGRVPAGPVEIEVDILLEKAAGVPGLQVVEAAGEKPASESGS